MGPETKRTSAAYQPKVSRRTTLKWLSGIAVTGVLTSQVGCSPEQEIEPQNDLAGPNQDMLGVWQRLNFDRVNAPGYGSDPDLLDPSSPWPLIMNQRELDLTAALGDMIIPEDEHSPSAAAVGAPDFINEWVSAPYENQHKDRILILSGLHWLDAESEARFRLGFVEAAAEQRELIADDIAFTGRIKTGYGEPARFFARFRSLISGGFYTTEDGLADLQYQGNTPIIGEYPGPTEDALEHLQNALTQLNLDKRVAQP